MYTMYATAFFYTGKKNSPPGIISCSIVFLRSLGRASWCSSLLKVLLMSSPQSIHAWIHLQMNIYDSYTSSWLSLRKGHVGLLHVARDSKVQHYLS